MVEIVEIKKVLSDTKTIIKHHRELTKAKGEHFNLFSVLKIQTRENNTHSAFLAELLNPNGSHDMGDIFLRLFLTTVNHNEKFEFEKDRIFNSDKAFVKVEQGIGRINLRNKEGEDASKASGGRIDIYLKDKKRNMISIENKIHAIDQEAQIQRYCNHEKKRNTVYYLTLKGENPCKESCLKLVAGEHFYNISYKDDIVNWLELCLKEVPNFTGLRESINQYILLIKKLTHILNKEEDKALEKTIVEYFEESKYISENYQNVANKIREAFRRALIVRLQNHLDPALYHIKSELPIQQNYSKIWVHFKNQKDLPFSFCVEPFSGNGNKDGSMFVGLYGHDFAKCKSIKDPNILNDVWQHVHWLTTAEDNNLHLNSANLLKALYNPESENYKKMFSNVFKQIVNFIDETSQFVEEDSVINESR